ncbi:MAG: AAA family ATPase [Myxococcota bacterium]|jgi:hypothetical protein|nr:AAA family ATPase [Myxococcota bacterium]
MLTRIRIENFRGFRLFDTAIAPVTAFLGPNSSGKTTVLHAVRLACEALRMALAANPVRPDPNDKFGLFVAKGMLVDPAQLLPLADWRALFVNQEVGEKVSRSIALSFELDDPLQELEVLLDCARNEQLKLTVRVRSIEAVALVQRLAKQSPKVSRQLGDYLTEHAPVAVLVPPFYGTVREEELRSRAVINRLLGTGDQSHVVRNMLVSLDPLQLERLNNFLFDTIGASITTRTDQNAVQDVTHLSVCFKDSNGDLELSAAGAGLINLVGLFAALVRWERESARRRVVFLIDEPEAHLHPRLQAESAKWLATLVTRQFAAQMLLATHSVDILNTLSTTGALLVRCDRAAQPTCVTLDSDSKLFEDLASWVDLTPYTALNFLAARRVVFCEGKDDLTLLPRLAELRFRDAPRPLQRFRRWAFLPLTGASNDRIAELLARLLRNDVVRAQGREGAFEVVTVLDRDHLRQPGLQTQAPVDGVTETRCVWSHYSIESVLLEHGVLKRWIRAFARDNESLPEGLDELIAEAIQAADVDRALSENASEQLGARLYATALTDASGKALGGEQKYVHASRTAKQLVREQPAVWQRGKDRARFILGRIRDGLELPLKNRFPVELTRLVGRANLNRLDPVSSIPAEIDALFTLLSTE